MSDSPSHIRVCVVTTTFPRWKDDSKGTFIYEAARSLVRQGASVRVLAMHEPGALDCETLDGIEIVRIHYMWPNELELLHSEGGGLPAVWKKKPWARLMLAPLVLSLSAAILRFTDDCQLVHANWTISAAAAVLTRPMHHKPVVVTVQGSDVQVAGRIPIVRIFTRQTLKSCQHVIALSPALGTETGALGIGSNRISVIPNGVDIVKFHPGSLQREPLIAFVGTVSDSKGIQYLIGAMPKILSNRPDLRLVVVGDGPQRADAERRARLLGVSDQVDFKGSLSPTQVRDLLQRTLVAVLPSLHEGLGVVLIEALACGTPCVGTNVGGIPSVLTPDVGILVPPRDEEALAAAIVAICTDFILWQERSRAARRRATAVYDGRLTAKNILRVYQGVLDEGSEAYRKESY